MPQEKVKHRADLAVRIRLRAALFISYLECRKTKEFQFDSAGCKGLQVFVYLLKVDLVCLELVLQSPFKAVFLKARELFLFTVFRLLSGKELFFD